MRRCNSLPIADVAWPTEGDPDGAENVQRISEFSKTAVNVG